MCLSLQWVTDSTWYTLPFPPYYVTYLFQLSVSVFIHLYFSYLEMKHSLIPVGVLGSVLSRVVAMVVLNNVQLHLTHCI